MYIPFVAAFQGEIKDAFSGIDFWTCFTIFDPRKLPEESPSLLRYGIDGLQTLLNHCGEPQKNTFKHVTINQGPDVEIEQTKLEWNGSKQFMCQKRKMHRNEMKIKISKCNNEDEVCFFERN